MNILLIRPPYTRLKQTGQAPYFPLGLGYIAAVLNKNGFEVNIYHVENPRSSKEKMFIDSDVIFKGRSESYHRYKAILKDNNHYVWKEVRDTLEWYKPDVVGISGLSVEVGSTLKIIKICKEYNRDCKVIWGGLHASFMPDDCIKNEDVDFVVVGEGEETVLDLCQTLQSNGKSLHDVRGILFKENGKVVHTPTRGLAPDLNDLPIPARDLILYPESFNHTSMGSMIASRGCPWRCTFCSSRNFWDQKLRFRDAESVIGEIKLLNEKYNTNYIMFWDDSFTIHRKVIKKYCEGILDAGLKISWRTATRADLIDEEMLGLMKKAGCIKLEIGIESGSERIRKEIKKDVSNEQIRKAFRMINKAGISTGAFFMAGFPYETEEDLDETARLMREIDSTEIAFNIYDPMPGSADYDTCVSLGLVSAHADWSDFPFWPDTHYMVNMSKDDFAKRAVEIAKWVFQYNNSLKIRFRRKKHLLMFYLKNDPASLIKEFYRMITARLRAHFSSGSTLKETK